LKWELAEAGRSLAETTAALQELRQPSWPAKRPMLASLYRGRAIQRAEKAERDLARPLH